MIDAPARIEATNVEDLVGAMSQAYQRDRERPLAINMAKVDAISRPAGALLVNLFLTELSKARIELVEPTRSPIEKFTYSGLGFAFAHRKGETVFRNITGEDLRYDRWKTSWTPAKQTANVQVELAGALTQPDEDPSFFFKAHAAFVNPHATSRRTHRRDIPYRVQGWLHSVLPPRAQRGAKGHDFIEELQALIYELVDNVAEHAWPESGPQPLSLVQVSVARGNEKETRDRIWVVVLDTGPGIPKTAGPKIGEPDLSARELLTGLLDGRFLQSEHRARGLGLPRVAKICSRWRDSHLSILSDDVRVSMENGAIKSAKLDRRVQGTVIAARFSTPPVLRDLAS